MMQDLRNDVNMLNIAGSSPLLTKQHSHPFWSVIASYFEILGQTSLKTLASALVSHSKSLGTILWSSCGF